MSSTKVLTSGEEHKDHFDQYCTHLVVRLGVVGVAAVAGAGGLVGGAALGLAVTQPPPRRSCSPEQLLTPPPPPGRKYYLALCGDFPAHFQGHLTFLLEGYVLCVGRIW